MDEEENVVWMDVWKQKKKSEEEVSEWYEDEEKHAGLPIFLAAAYSRGILDGKIQKWMELRIHILSLIASNLIAFAVIIWLLSK